MAPGACPPVLHADVSRPRPITLGWSTYAQSLTDRPVTAMLTGPVTILAWSFVRDDQPLGDIARQVGLALRDEVRELEAAGLRVIQVDEPACASCSRWARLHGPATCRGRSMRSGWSPVGGSSTQIHTHLCYSEFGAALDAIDALDADVTTLEAARSTIQALEQFGTGMPRGVGTGVYDVHSPRVPTVDEIEQRLLAARRWISPERLWGQPGLWAEDARRARGRRGIADLVHAAHRVRASIPTLA